MIFELEKGKYRERCPSIKKLLDPGISSILIKGLPGTGKTTLALELLKLTGGGLYFSTHMSEKKLFSQLPNVQLIMGEPSKEFVDIRLGTAEILLRKVIDAITKNRGPLIVLDSWDSIAKEMGAVERLKVERSIVAMVETSGSTVVFVSEEPHLTTMDYLVDAIITLRDETYEGMRLRVIQWDKIRGRPLPNKTNLFTLYNGRFSILWGCDPLGEPFPTIDLTKAFEGSNVVLLELDHTVHSEGIEPLIHALISEFVSEGYSLVAIPIGMETPKAMFDRIRKLGIKDKVSIGGFYRHKDIFLLDDSSVEKTLDRLIEEGEALGGPCLYVIGCDVLEHLFGKSGLVKLIFRLSRVIREKDTLLICIISQGSGSVRELANLSDVHIKFKMINQALLGYMVKPQGVPSIISSTFMKRASLRWEPFP